MPLPAHPDFLTGRVAEHQRVIWNIFNHHATGSDKSVAPKRDAADDRRTRADRRQVRCLRHTAGDEVPVIKYGAHPRVNLGLVALILGFKIDELHNISIPFYLPIFL
jgi:hypothetical protein